MKFSIGLILLTAVCWFIALVLSAIGLVSKKRHPEIGLGSLFFAIPFFVIPIFAVFASYMQEKTDATAFKEDVAYVKELCAKYGGDHIYKTVDNIEGIFRIKERHPDYDTQEKDQFGMIDPYGDAQRDPQHVEYFLMDQQISSLDGYIYVEAPAAFGTNGPPYKRFYLEPTGRTIGDKYPYKNNAQNPELKVVEKKVEERAGRYGYVIEDLSTREMRKRWIGGGRIKIIDLKTNEILAERVGYFRAIGPAAMSHWSGESAYGNQRICPYDSDIKKFLHSVLKPVPYRPLPEYSDFKIER